MPVDLASDCDGPALKLLKRLPVYSSVPLYLQQLYSIKHLTVSLIHSYKYTSCFFGLSSPNLMSLRFHAQKSTVEGFYDIFFGSDWFSYIRGLVLGCKGVPIFKPSGDHSPYSLHRRSGVSVTHRLSP